MAAVSTWSPMPQPPSGTSSTRTMVLGRARSPYSSAYRSVVRWTMTSFCSALSVPTGTLKFANGKFFSFD